MAAAPKEKIKAGTVDKTLRIGAVIAKETIVTSS